MFTPILMTFPGDSAVTRAVAEEIAATLGEEMLETDVRPLHMVSGLKEYGSVMLGAPIVDGRWVEQAREFLRAHRTELVDLPVAVFAVAPPGVDPDDVADDRAELLEELAHLRWLHPIAADLFRETGVPMRASRAPSTYRPGELNGHPHAFDIDAVSTWARWVARVLQPATR